MKTKALALVAAACVLAVGSAAKADPVNVTYYSNFTENFGSNISMSDAFFSETLPGIDIDFGAGGGPVGRPTPSNVFAADFTGHFTAPSTGSYNLTFGSDDASYLFVDGSLFASSPGNHGFGTATSPVSLTAGAHSFELQYDNVFCCGARVAFDLDRQLQFSSGAPEPAAWGLMLVGFGGLGAVLRRRRSAGALAA